MKKLIIAFTFGIQMFVGYSQMNIINPSLLSGGISDGEKLLKAYVTPWSNMFGSSLSGGWYNTAKPHKLGGFDITITANCAIAPLSDRTFSINELGLTNLKLSADQPETSPTIVGKHSEGSSMDYVLNETTTIPNVMKLPKGTGLPIIFTPMVQAGIGLFKGTELIGRYSPAINLGKSGKIDMWGVGLKHSLFQYLPADKVIPLDISPMIGYTKFRMRSNLDFRPDYFKYDVGVPESFDNQNMQMDVQSITGNLLISTTIPIFNVYGGVGYNWIISDFKMNGDYPIPSGNYDATDNQILIKESDIITDPINLRIKSKSALRYNIGIRLKFGLLTWQVDYTYAYYSMISTGIGLSFR